MNQNQPPVPNSSEEIDLGQLFNLMGRAIQRFIDFIKKTLKYAFKAFINLLLFLQKHFWKLVIAGILGLILGIGLDYYRGPLYQSTMVVEPNFNAVQQLYNNIQFYNELANAQDSMVLAEVLEIPVKDAAAIKRFKVDSYADDNQKVKLFNEFVLSLDSSVQRTIDMSEYLKNFNSFDARFHTITLIARSPDVAKKTQNGIISSIARNDYFKLQKSIADVNLSIQDSMIRQQLKEIDSLQALYKRIMEKEAEKPMQGTNISLGEGGSQEQRELALLTQRELLKLSLVELNEERGTKSNIINVISDFPRQGVRLKGFLHSYKLIGPPAMITLTLIILLLLDINKALIRYREKYS